MVEGQVLAEVKPQGRLLVVGDEPVVEAIVPMAQQLEWQVTAVATAEEAYPDVATADAVVVLSHDDEVDGPALRAALAAGTAYVGAMGSRRTQARRRGWLVANGVEEAAVDRVHGPAGLDIGAETPAEIALSILAEVVAIRRGASASGSLSDRPGPIHPG